MKVIFLDIDGVMNSTDFYNRKRASSWEWAHMAGKYLTYAVDPDEVIRLNRIITETGAVVVLSSSWRLGPPISVLKEDFKRVNINITDSCPCWGELGVTDLEIVKDENGQSHSTIIPRGEIIDRYLSEHPEITQYVILDDTDQFTEEQHEHFILTNKQFGLSEEDTINAIKILNA